MSKTQTLQEYHYAQYSKSISKLFIILIHIQNMIHRIFLNFE